MITSLKLAGMSAVLSAGLLAGFPAIEAQQAANSTKLFQDRLGEGGLAVSAVSASLPTDIVDRSAKGDRLKAASLTMASR